MPLAFISVVYACVQILGIGSAVHALFTVRTSQGTVAWVIGLLAIPWLALPMYWVFGCRRFDSHARVMQTKRMEYATRLQAVADVVSAYQVSRDALVPRVAGPVAELAGQEFLSGNRLKLLIDGTATFDAIIEAIESAQRSVYVQFYIMRNDGLGNRLLDAMAARAEAGVEVCFLFDSFGGKEMKPSIVEKWRERGIRMAAFCARSANRDRWRLNFRNHRKNVIVDGRIGFIGGHNVGDEYLGLDPEFGRWRDTHVRVEGPVVLQLQMSFASDWYFITGEMVHAQWMADVSSPTGPACDAVVLESGPSDTFERCTLFFMHVIGMAQSKVWIASPYFVPDEGIIQALQLAAMRGVEVRILIPLNPDQWLVWLASFAMLKELDHPNIHIHRFTGGFLHHKAVLVDGDFAAIGTANFDNRSFRLNFEITLAVANAGFVSEVTRMFEKDFAESRESCALEYYELPLHMKAGVKIARLCAPIL